MFTHADARMLFKSAKLRIDGEGHRIAEIALVVEPLPHHLAEDVYPELARHVFDEHGLIRDELKDITIDPGFGTQHAEFRLDTDMEPELVSNEVTVLKYQAKRIEDGEGTVRVRASVTIECPLDTKQSREFVVNHFGHDVFVTSRAIQPTLDEAVH